MMQIVHYHGHTQSGEPTVRLQRLEDEMNRYGRVIPKENGSYVLNPSRKSKRRTSSDVQSYINLEDKSISINSGEETNYAYGERNTTYFGKNNCEQISEVGMKTVTYSGISSNNKNIVSASLTTSSASLTTPSTSQTAPSWPPLYEDISDSETESGNSSELKHSAPQICEYVGNDNTIPIKMGEFSNSNLPPNHEQYIPDMTSQPKAILTEDTVAGKTGAKRRHSAPEELSPHEEKRKHKHKEKRRRRWSFNSKADLSPKIAEKKRRKFYLNKLTFERQVDKKYRLLIGVSSSDEFYDDDEELNYSLQIKKEPNSSDDDTPRKVTFNQTNSIETKTKTVAIEDEDTIEAPNEYFSTVKEETDSNLSNSSKSTLEHLPKDTDMITIQDDDSSSVISCENKASELLENASHLQNINSEMSSQNAGSLSEQQDSSSSSGTSKNAKEHTCKFTSQEISDKDKHTRTKHFSSRKENFEERSNVKRMRDSLKKVMATPSVRIADADVINSAGSSKKFDSPEPVLAVTESKSEGMEISDSGTFSNKSHICGNNILNCSKGENSKSMKHHISNKINKISDNNSQNHSKTSNSILESTSKLNKFSEDLVEAPILDADTKDMHTFPEKSKFEYDTVEKIEIDLTTSEDKSKKEEMKSNVCLKRKTKFKTGPQNELKNIRKIRKRFRRQVPVPHSRFQPDETEVFITSSKGSSHSNQLENLSNIPQKEFESEITPCSSQLSSDTTVVVIEDETPSPGSLTIDLDASDTNVKDNTSSEEIIENTNKTDEVIMIHDEKSSKKKTASLEEQPVESSDSKKKTTEIDDQTLIEDLDIHTKEKDCEAVEEGQGKKKRKKVKKKNSGDSSVMDEVMGQILSNQMQEKGRRLAQELPGFNWLEEKIRNGGVSNISKKRASTQEPSNPQLLSEASKSSVVLSADICHSFNKAILTKTASKIPVSISSELSVTSNNEKSPEKTSLENCDELRHPLKKPRQFHPGKVPDSEAQSQEVSRNTVCSSSDKSVNPEIPSLLPVEQSQRIPESLPVTDNELYLKKQPSRRPVIVSASELAQTPVVDPLLQQLTSGGELEVTLSMPQSSASLSDSTVGSIVMKTPSGTEHSELTYVSVEPVKSSHKPQENSDNRQGLSVSNNQPKRINCVTDDLSQSHITKGSEMQPPERYQLQGMYREAQQWENVLNGSVRECLEASQAMPPHLPNPQLERGYSDRITTMARHAAMSFDTGLVGPAAVLEAAHRAQRRPFQRPPVSTTMSHQPQQTSEQTEPHPQQIASFDPRFQYPRPYPGYLSQNPLRPQIVRPSAHYPPMIHYRPQPPYIQPPPGTTRPCLIPGVPQYAFIRQPGPLQIPQKDIPPKSIINNNNAQQMTNKVPRSSANEISHQIVPGIERSAAHDLEMLKKLKQATKEEIHSLNLKKEQALRALQQIEKQIELPAAAAGQVHPRSAVPNVTAASVPMHQREEGMHVLQRQDKTQMPNRTSHIHYKGQELQHIPTSVALDNRKQDANSNLESHIDIQRHETVNIPTGDISTWQKCNTTQRIPVSHHKTYPLLDQPKQVLAQISNVTGDSLSPLEMAHPVAEHHKPIVSSGIRNAVPPLQVAPHLKSKVVLGTLHLPQFSPGHEGRHESIVGAEKTPIISPKQRTNAAISQFTEDQPTSIINEAQSIISHNKQQIPNLPSLLPRPPPPITSTTQPFPSQIPPLYHCSSKDVSHQQTQNSPQLSPVQKTNPLQQEPLPVKQLSPLPTQGTLKSHLLKSSPPTINPATDRLHIHTLPGSQQRQSLPGSHLSHYQQSNISQTPQQLIVIHAAPPTTEHTRNSVNTSTSTGVDQSAKQFNVIRPPPPLKPAPLRTEETVLLGQTFTMSQLPHAKTTSQIMPKSQDNSSQKSNSAATIASEDCPIDLSISKQKSSNNLSINQESTSGKNAITSKYTQNRSEKQTQNIQNSFTDEENSQKHTETLQADIKRAVQQVMSIHEQSRVHKPSALSSQNLNRVNHPYPAPTSIANADVTENKSTASQQRYHSDRHEQVDSSTENNENLNSPLAYSSQRHYAYSDRQEQVDSSTHYNETFKSQHPHASQQQYAHSDRHEQVDSSNQNNETFKSAHARTSQPHHYAHSDRHEQVDSSTQNNGTLNSPPTHSSQQYHYTPYHQHPKLYTQHYQQPQHLTHVSASNSSCSSVYQQRMVNEHLTEKQTHAMFESQSACSNSASRPHQSQVLGTMNTTETPRTLSSTSSEVSEIRDTGTSTSTIASSSLSVTSSEASQVATKIQLPVKVAYSYSCVKCNRIASFMCSACHQAHYCSSQCQTRHWETHRLECEGRRNRSEMTAP